MQHLHPGLLQQQPAHCFEDNHLNHNGSRRDELLSDQVLDFGSSGRTKYSTQPEIRNVNLNASPAYPDSAHR